MQFRDKREVREKLLEAIQHVPFPYWSMSDHIRYCVRKELGLWHEPYLPAKPSHEGTPRKRILPLKRG